MQVTAVLFDLGGTLFGYERREEMGRPTRVALQRLGLDPDDPTVVAARQRAGQEVEAEYAGRASFLHRDLFRDRVSRTADLMGIRAPADVLARFDEEHLQAILEHLVPRPDAASTLTALRQRGIHTAVVSNADDDYLGALLRRHKLDPLLDGWISSEEARSCKPDRAIFELALARAGRSASETVFVGDSPEHDVAGAAAVGMRTVLIGEPGAVAPLSHGLAATGVADAEVRTLTEVLAVVDGLNGPPGRRRGP